MGVSGNLRTMALPDLLQWAKVNNKSGTFDLERNGVRRCLAFRDGTIVACVSNDASLLGQYLLGASKITSGLLQTAMATKRATGRSLAEIVVEQGIITEDELREQLTVRAEETIYSLFDWMDATFRFDDTGVIDGSWTEVEIDVDSILLNGLQRLDEVKMIRNAFPGSGIVLERTESPAPEQIANSGMARRILASIDGRATLAEILEQAQASDFLVLKFLYHLFQKEVIVICESLPPAPGAATLVDDIVPLDAIEDGAEVAADIEVVEEPAQVALSEVPEAAESPLLDTLAEAANMFAEDSGEPSEAPVEIPEAVEVPASLAAAAADLMADADMGFPTEPEIDVSYAVEVDLPANDATPEPTVAAEPAAPEPEPAPEPEDVPLNLAPDRVPVMLREVGSLIDENLSAESCMLVQLIGAQMDIAMLLGTAPFSEEAVLTELRSLAERGIIEVRHPDEVETVEFGAEEASSVDPVGV